MASRLRLAQAGFDCPPGIGTTTFNESCKLSNMAEMKNLQGTCKTDLNPKALINY